MPLKEWRWHMFKVIRSAFKSMTSLKKKVEYHAEKQIVLTFYSDIALIFSFDKEMVSLCREMNELVKADDHYSNLDKCETVNSKIQLRLGFLEHSRMAQKFLQTKKTMIENLEKAMRKNESRITPSQESV
jgi:hypothetical protein